MWHVAPGSCYWIRQVAAPAMWHMALGWHAIEFVQKSAILYGGLLDESILELYFWFRFQSYQLPQSTCHCAQLWTILSKSDRPRQKNEGLRWWISAILDFRGPIMGSLKSLCTTSCRSSIDIIALNCLVFGFWENRVFAFWRQTDRQTN